MAVIRNHLPVSPQFQTLGQIREFHGEEQERIDYMKLDIEGHEVLSIMNWTEEEMRNIKQVEIFLVIKKKYTTMLQIAIEIHMFASDYGDKKQYYLELLKVFTSWQKQGFKLASYSPNMIQGKQQELDQRYHSFFDLLFVRKTSNS